MIKVGSHPTLIDHLINNIQKMFPYYLYLYNFSSAIVRLNVKTVIDEMYGNTH